MADTQEKLTLDQLPVGGSCILCQVGNQRGAVKRRLIDMGLTPGTEVKLVKIAPFGDPLELRLRGYELSLRKEDAAQIRIRPLEEKEAGKQAVPETAYHLGGGCHGDCAHCAVGCSNPKDLEAMRRAHRHEQSQHPQNYDPHAHDQRQWKVALVGNPNCGKTTLFNALTGSNQHVGNFPGVTVDQKMGEMRDEKGCSVVDLPGIYSLRPYTQEEIVSRDFIIHQKPDGIINIVDATNIERNLYLTLQLLELRVPMVLALNMMDEVHANGGAIDVQKMSQALGIPVVPISAAKGEGVSELVDQALTVARSRTLPKVTDFCSDDSAVHRCIHAVVHLIADHADRIGVPARFCAAKLIEGGDDLTTSLELDENELELLEHCIVQMENETGLDRNAALADMRYTFIEGVVASSVVKCHESKEHARSIKIDRILTGKYTALPTFLVVMFLTFYLTFNVIGQWLSDLLQLGIDALTGVVDAALTAYGINPVVHSLIIDGVFAGVGSVLVFLPIIVTLFFFLSILEDTGYMARVAFVMDKPLRKIGLSGRSIVPMLIGFGCSVPAIMATRTVSSDRDRKMTILLTPYMSCSAKISIYAFFTAAFFPRYRALVMLGLYVLGILIGIIAALIMNKTAFRGKPVPFVMELPNYRMPGLKSVALLLWEKAKDFLQRAFTVIFLATIIIWFLQSFDTRLNVVADSANSLLALIGQFIAPVFRPLGFGDWRCATALISGFIAKESVVSTMQVLLGGAAISSLLTTRSAISFLVFTLLYTPCVAAIATIRRELDSRLKTVGVVVLQCSVAWVVALVAYAIAGLV